MRFCSFVFCHILHLIIINGFLYNSQPVVTYFLARYSYTSMRKPWHIPVQYLQNTGCANLYLVSKFTGRKIRYHQKQRISQLDKVCWGVNRVEQRKPYSYNKIIIIFFLNHNNYALLLCKGMLVDFFYVVQIVFL